MFKNKLLLIALLIQIMTILSCASFEAKAVAEGNIEDISVFISKGGDLNSRQIYGKTLLIIAAESGKVNMIEFLIKNGADYELIADNGKTALIAASGKGSLNSVKVLIELGALIDGTSSRGDTAMHYAASGNRKDVLSFLITKGADINKLNFSGSSPLLEALYYNSGEDQGISDCVQYLINAGADLNIQKRNMIDVAFETAESGNVDLMELLISYGFDVRQEDVWGNSLLFPAVENISMLTLLLRNELSPDVTNFDGNTVLHEALYSDNKDSFAELLSFRAEPDKKNKQGRTPLMDASALKYTEYIRMLLIAGANPNLFDYSNNNSLHYAASFGDLETVRLLLIAGIDPNIPNGIGETPLQLAVENEDHGNTIRDLLFEAGGVE